jgi:hypothetical protein
LALSANSIFNAKIPYLALRTGLKPEEYSRNRRYGSVILKFMAPFWLSFIATATIDRATGKVRSIVYPVSHRFQ